MFRISRSIPVLLVAAVGLLLGPHAGTINAGQLPGIGDEASWRERKLRELKSDDVHVRRAAIEALYREDIDGTKLIDALIPVMSDEDFRVRRSAVVALRVHGQGRADVVKAFRSALVDCDPGLAPHLIYALTEVDPHIEESLNVFAEAALRDDRHITPDAVRAMKEIGAPAVPALVEMLKEPSWLVREEAIAALVGMGELARPAVPKIVGAATVPSNVNLLMFCPKLVTWPDEAVAELMKLVRRGPASRAAVAIDCLAAMEEKAAAALPALLQIAEDAAADGGTRRAAIRALARVGRSREDVLRCLMNLIEGERDKYSRKAALHALGQFKERAAPAVPLLVAVVRGDDDILLKNPALRSLGWIQPPADVVLPLCIEVLGGDEPDTLKETAVWVIAQYGPEAAAAWPALRPLLKAKGRLRRSAIDSMVAMGIADPSVVPDLCTAVREGDRFEGEAAIKALVALGPSASAAVPDLLDLVRNDANQGASAASALGVILDDAAAIPPEISDEMRPSFEKGRRFQRERVRQTALGPAGSDGPGPENGPGPNEIVGEVFFHDLGVEGARVALSPALTSPGEEPEARIATTNDLGTFRFSEVPRGSYDLVVFHPGHEPYLAPVSLAQSPQLPNRRHRITLGPAEPKAFTVVNAENAPLPNVVVRINRYRSAPMPLVELRSDASGEFSFPVGRGFVGGQAEHPGYMRTKFVLSANRDRSTVLMLKPYRIRGKVTDAKTRAPIASFTVTRAFHLGKGPAFVEDEGEPLGSFTNGTYEILFEEFVNLTAPFNQLALAFDAPGYQQGVSPSYEEGSGDLVFDIELVPQGGTKGQLIDKDGIPVVGAEVVLATAGLAQPVSLLNGRPHWTMDRLPRFTTDADGRFAFPAQSQRFALLVTDDRGFSIVLDRVFAEQSTIQLTLWARLSGVVRRGNDVVSGADVDVNVGPPVQLRTAEPRDVADAIQQAGLFGGEDSWRSVFRYSVKTDAHGKFSLDRVCPGRVRVSLPVQTGVHTLFSIPKETIDLSPGEVYEVSLGGGGRRVIGRIDLPRVPRRFGDGFEPCTSLFAGVVFDRAVMPQPTRQEAMRLRGLPRPFFPFGFQEDGTFRIDDVQSGKYRLVIGLRCAGESAPPDYFVDHEFDLPAGDLDVPFDLGELKPIRISE